MTRSRPRRTLDDGADAAPERPCDWPGCGKRGAHRAPLSRGRIDEFQYFCLDHAREFNGAWNFFEGWSSDEIDAWRHADLTWHRPTWRPDERLVRNRAFREARANGGPDDPFGFMGGARAGPRAARGGSAPPGDDRAYEEERRRALGILKLRPGADGTAIKRRFKREVKACHPDLNGGRKEAGDRLRDVIWAYRRLTAR